MSEKSREEEKLSFKEQILRDLEKVKGYDEVLKEDEAVVRTPANEPSTEELMADSLLIIHNIIS
ncbi:aminodeoxychorismate lyase [Streptococcus pneumoniae]|nr:aminodeoxychorismate lyase [Streptococcus pneumoniae]